jgi:hypothetical protein
MEDSKKHTHSHLSDCVAEPIGATSCPSPIEKFKSLDWEGMPSIGPSSYEEAVSRIEEAEREIDENGGVAWDEVLQAARLRVN